MGSIARVWRAAGAHHDTWLSGDNGWPDTMAVQVVVTWDDGAPTTRETVPVGPFARWARNLADYRPGLRSNVNATVRVKADKVTAVFAELWFGADYAKAGGYGYELATKCLP